MPRKKKEIAEQLEKVEIKDSVLKEDKPKKQKTLDDVIKQNKKPKKKITHKYNVADIVYCKTDMHNQLTIHSIKENNKLFIYRCYDNNNSCYYILEELLIKL